jgi:hypothetical protein
MDLVFRVAGLVLVLALVVVFFLPEEKLRSMSGIQARQQEADEAVAAAAAAANQVSAPSSQMVDGQLIEESAVPDAREPDQVAERR